jgi:hypothetical protein
VDLWLSSTRADYTGQGAHDEVWIWVALPFPVSDPYKDNPFPDIPSWPYPPKNGTVGHGDPSGGDDVILPIDVNFYFFLIW